jgi:hypothetical protein
VRFEVAAREIPDRVYHTDSDLRAAFRDARPVTLAGSAAGVISSER